MLSIGEYPLLGHEVVDAGRDGFSPKCLPKQLFFASGSTNLCKIKITFVTFLNQRKGVCSRGETDTLNFALKDVILYDFWKLLLSPLLQTPGQRPSGSPALP